MAGAKPPTSLIAAGVLAVVLAAGLGLMALKPALQLVGVPTTVAPVAEVPPAPAPAPAESTKIELRFAIVPSSDGIVTLAGTGPAGLPVSIRLDGVELQRVASLGDGSFAAVLEIPPAELPRVLSVAAILPDGTEIQSKDVGFLPPTAAPVVAEAEPVIAPPEIAPIVLGDEGATVASVQPLDIPLAQVTLDAVTYTPEGLVQFSGKGQPGAFVRLYLEGEFLMESGVRSEGQWFAENGDIVAGIYSLRIDQIDATGKVSARFETPFLRETQETLAQIVVAATEAASAPTVVEAVPVSAPPLPVLPKVVIVQPGLTLWAIAQAELGDGVAYVQVFKANRDKIKDADLIYPGQIFAIPGGN